jgi:hypothetical protein
MVLSVPAYLRKRAPAIEATLVTAYVTACDIVTAIVPLAAHAGRRLLFVKQWIIVTILSNEIVCLRFLRSIDRREAESGLFAGVFTCHRRFLS